MVRITKMNNEIYRLGAPIKYCDLEFECLKTGNPNLNGTMNLYLSGADVLTCSGKILEILETEKTYKVKGEMFI